MAKPKKIELIRDLLVISTAVLMILIAIFQWMEIREFDLQDVIGSRLKALFVAETSDAPAVPNVPAKGAEGAPAGGAPAVPAVPDAPADGAPAADAPAGL